ncbi:MAG: NUDIX hydrolase [Eubacteriales bacterium]|nr:NUDIX hydrolase [Eubacteriales bacterium]
MKKPYEIIKTEKIFQGKVFDITRDEITLPDGNTTLRETVLRGDATAIVPIDNDGNVILVRQYRHPALKEILEIPAGMLEKGEDPIECAKRELEEETSFKADELIHLTTIYPAVGICTEKIHIYLAKDLKQGKFNFDPDEFITIEKYSLDDAIELIYKGEIIDSKTIVGLLTCKKFL